MRVSSAEPMRIRRLLLLAAVLPVALQPARAQVSGSPDSSHVDGARLALVGGVVAGSVAAIHLYQQNAWWKGERSRFHVQEDLVYALNVDKVGHLYGSIAVNYALRRSLEWSNVSERTSLLWACIGATLFQTYVEVEDGFSKDWGFDRVDFAADVVGAWYPLIQREVPTLQNVNLRFSYLPKSPGGKGALPGQTHTVFDDYEGQTMWLTLSMHDLLPVSMRDWWPDFLCLSVGMAVRDNNSPDRYLCWYIAPDLDMTKIIPPSTPLLKTLGEILNFFHMPMPAVRFAPHVVWYGFYW
jgi:hypothetical protein